MEDSHTYYVSELGVLVHNTKCKKDSSGEVEKIAMPEKAGKGGSGKHPTWRQSEIDAKSDFPDYREQVSFKDGIEVDYGTKGSVRPDFYKDGYSIDIKNYNVQTSAGRSSLVNNIVKQYNQRLPNLPKGTKQSILIDIRGQNVNTEDLNSLYNRIMKKTNNNININFKTD